MSQKRNKPAAPGRDVRKLSTPEKIALLGNVELARNKATWAEVLQRAMPPQEAQERLADALPYFSPPPRSGAGRPRDPALDAAARDYVAAVDAKDRMRRDGFGGLPLDSVTLASIAAKHFPGLDAAGANGVEASIKNAAKKYREKSRR